MPWEVFANRTSHLPARIFGLKDRGTVAPGKIADLVLFDPATVREGATFADPIRLPEGIHHVIVNGRLAVRDGRANGVLAGYGIARGR